MIKNFNDFKNGVKVQEDTDINENENTDLTDVDNTDADVNENNESNEDNVVDTDTDTGVNEEHHFDGDRDGMEDYISSNLVMLSDEEVTSIYHQVEKVAEGPVAIRTQFQIPASD